MFLMCIVLNVYSYINNIKKEKKYDNECILCNVLVNSRAFLSWAPGWGDVATTPYAYDSTYKITIHKTHQRNTPIAQMLHVRIVKWWTVYCGMIIKDNLQ